MSKTTNLQLFKHDEPLETNENDFDVGEALNDNWDILDTFAGQVNTKIQTLEKSMEEASTNLDTLETNIETLQSNVTSLQTDNETNKQDIQDLQSEQETQNTAIENNTEELELLKNNLPDPITTEESEEITVKDAMNYYSELDVSGNSTQDTRSGKNKLKLSDVEETTSAGGITYSVKDGVISLNGTSTRSHYINFKSDAIDLPANNYTMSTKVLSGSYSGIAGKQLNETAKEEGVEDTNIFSGGYMQDTYTHEIEEDKTGVYLSLYIGGTAVLNNYKFEIQLEEGTEATEIEKYGTMPSPDYPSEIKNCGDNVNFVGGALTVGYYGLSGQLTSDNLYRCFKANLKKGTYKYSYNADLYFVRQINLTTGTNLTINNNSFTLENDAEISLGFRRSDSYAWDLGETLEDLQFAIKEGTGEVRYSPYKCGSVDIKVENSNTFNQANGFKSGGTDRAVVNEDGSITTTSNFSNSRNKGVFVELKKNTNYTVSLDIVSMETSSTNKRGIAEVCSYNEDESFNSGLIANKTILDTDVGTRISFSFNSGDYDKWAVQVSGWYGSGQTGSLTYKNVMVSELTDINFVEHKEKIITFPLKEGQLLHAGDYLTSDGVHHVKQTCVFDGTENIIIAYNDETIDSFRIAINSKYNQMLGYQIDDKCSHFKNLGHTPAWGRQANTFALSSEGYLYIFFEKNKITSETEAKNWITEQYNNGTPLTAEGTLEEEYVEPYTEEQQAAHNELQKLLLYKGYNYIACIDETKCKMQLTYRPDNNIKIKSLEERVTALENSEVTA